MKTFHVGCNVFSLTIPQKRVPFSFFHFVEKIILAFTARLSCDCINVKFIGGKQK